MIDRRAFVAGTAAAFAWPTGPAAARVAPRTVSYGRERLDIYTPFGLRGAPVLIHVHGGGWVVGNRRNVHGLPEFAARLGMVLVSVDYRKIPRANVPYQKQDVAAAIGWVRANIARYGGDPGRIAVMGHSAGAHLAALAVFDGSAGPVSALFCNDSAAWDVAALNAAYGGDMPYLFRNAFRRPEQWQALSPASHIGSRPHPPVMIAWTAARHNAALSRAFADKLHKAGVAVTQFDGSRRYSHRSIMRRIGRESGGITAALDGFLRATVGAGV